MAVAGHRTRWVVALAAAQVAGCLLSPPRPVLPARGPGDVFLTVDEAALHALRYASSLSRHSRLEYGGAVRRVTGGFTYDAPVRGTEETVAVRLGPEAVAWFHTHSHTASSLVNRRNERPSSLDREMVDRVDPLHRPAYILTPSGRVIVYCDGRVAQLDLPPAWMADSQASPDSRGEEHGNGAGL